MEAKPKSFRIKILVAIFALVGAFALGFGTASSLSGGWIGQQLTSFRFSGGKPSGVDFSLLWETWNQLHQNYVGTPDDQKLVYGSVQGMVAGVGDPYTVFFDPTEAKQFSEDVTGQFFGIGIEIGMQNNLLTVITPLDDSPAGKAGIKSGDIIIAINDKDTSNMTIDQAVTLIRGDRGTAVKLTILPKGTTDKKDLSVVRDLIQVKSVKSEVKPNNIGYIRINQFSNDTTDLTKQAIKDLQAQHVKGVVLDLRNNPGGFLQGAQEVASMFISHGVVVSELEKSGQKQDLFTVSDPIMADTPMVVLINGGSASAAEILAGAIQDRGRAKLVGEKSFGKGSVQNVINLSGGSILKVTIAEWLTPNGRHINGQGIQPDTVVTLTADDAKNNRDPQLDKALQMVSQ